MPLSDSSRWKIKNIDATISRLLDGDFPFESGKRALQRIRKVFEEILKKLERADKIHDEQTVQSVSAQINLKIFQSLPVIGFILRSTNVRNSFELIYPFQQIADSLLQGRPRLLLSSEWDYVPFAYPQTLEDLKGFVLIGMPASESGNALLSPLAAHELGHAVWKNRGIAGGVLTTLQICCEELYQEHMQKFEQIFSDFDPEDMVAKEILPESIALSVEYAGYQAEEIFCDMFAYALFGASYLFAFGYIVAPGLGRPSPRYPTYKSRISTLREVAKNEGVDVPTFADLGLVDIPRSGFPIDRFVIEMSESSVSKIRVALWEKISELITKCAVSRPAGNSVTKHVSEFRMGVPGCDPRSLGDIVNAGWIFYREDILPYTDKAQADLSFENLNELILKTIEVLEYSQRNKNGSNS